jgi:hypothetical protein
VLVVGRTNLPRFIDICVNITVDRLCSPGLMFFLFTVFVMNLILDFVLRNFVTCNMIIGL